MAPEHFRLDEFVSRGLAARNDSRQVLADQSALYFGVHLGERTLLPEDDAEVGETRFEDWLRAVAA